MQLSIGIVGLPNVGKSTMFNALLKKQVADAANYPFCTIEPNVGIVEVPDERLPALAKVVNSTKIVPAAVEFYDIAGLVKGASKGEGLGNKFLSHIREVAAIVHVVRLFDDSNVIHVNNKVDPIDDIKTVETELILADLETVLKHKVPKHNAEKETIQTHEVAQKIKSDLDRGLWANQTTLTDEEKHFAKSLNLLTMKPIIYVFNVSESQLENKEKIDIKIKEILQAVGAGSSSPNLKNPLIKGEKTSPLQKVHEEEGYLYLNAKLETDVLAFSEAEQKEFLQQYGLNETGLNRLIKKSYETLGLISFLTAGEKEVRAWTIAKGTLAPQAAGVIHTDFEKHFIKAEVVKFEDFINPMGLARRSPDSNRDEGGWVKAREQGKVQIVGKDYVMQDNDVVEFKIGV